MQKKIFGVVLGICVIATCTILYYRIFSGVGVFVEKELPKFRLLDSKNQTLDEKSIEVPCLFTFGYTKCNSVCPQNWGVLRDVQRNFESGFSIPIYFITIDVESDTKERLALFEQNFNPGFFALRGNGTNTKELAKEFGEAEPSLQETEIIHNGFIYWISRERKIKRIFFPNSITGKQLSVEIKKLSE